MQLNAGPEVATNVAAADRHARAAQARIRRDMPLLANRRAEVDG